MKILVFIYNKFLSYTHIHTPSLKRLSEVEKLLNDIIRPLLPRREAPLFGSSQPNPTSSCRGSLFRLPGTCPPRPFTGHPLTP